MITTNIDEFCELVHNCDNNNFRVLGIDYGTRKTGLAITGYGFFISSPLQIIETNNNLINNLFNIISEKDIGAIVFGYPIDDNNNLHSHGYDVIKIADFIHSKLTMPICLMHEGYTTINAKNEFFIMNHSIINSQKIRERKKRSQIKKYAILKDQNDDMYAANILLKTFSMHYKNLYSSVKPNS